MLDDPKRNLGGEGLQKDKHLPQSPFTCQFFWITTFCFGVPIVNFYILVILTLPRYWSEKLALRALGMQLQMAVMGKFYENCPHWNAAMKVFYNIYDKTKNYNYTFKPVAILLLFFWHRCLTLKGSSCQIRLDQPESGIIGLVLLLPEPKSELYKFGNYSWFC